MSVNIFGSSGQFSNDIANKRYVDQKFATLSTNLTSKVNKAGDTISGDFKMLINDDQIRTFGVTDIGTGKSMSLLLGDDDNQIRHNFGHPLKIAAVYGTKFTCPAGETCRMGAQSDARAQFSKDIIMNDNSITGLHNPIDEKDAATKQYVDTRVAKSGDTMTGNLLLSVGYDLLRTIGCSDLSDSKKFAILLGSDTNQIQCQLNQPIIIQAAKGLMCKLGSNNIIRFGRAANDFRIDVYNDILMNNRYITNLREPNTPRDAVTKSYADKLTKKCYSGYIPQLEADTSMLGFIASASTVTTANYAPYKAFNNFEEAWVASDATGWLQIECPEAVTIWRVALKARANFERHIIAWNITGSIDGTTFTTLLASRAEFGSCKLVI